MNFDDSNNDYVDIPEHVARGLPDPDDLPDDATADSFDSLSVIEVYADARSHAEQKARERDAARDIRLLSVVSNSYS